MVNTPHKHTHKGFTCSKQFRLLGHRLQFQLLPFLLFWILRRRHFCFYTPWCLLTNVTVKSSLCWCHLSAGTCRLTGQIRQLLLALLTDEATQNQHPKWRRKQMDIPTCFFLKKDNSWSMMHMVAWALHDVFRQAFYCFIFKKDNKQGNY